MNNIWILAQTEGGQTSSGITSEPVTGEDAVTTVTASDPNVPAARTRPKGPLESMTWIWLVLMLVLMYFLLFRGPQKQKQERKKLVQSLRKNDRVQTIGGILGTIVDIEGDKITLKIDESNNTKMKVTSSAIGKNFSQDKT